MKPNKFTLYTSTLIAILFLHSCTDNQDTGILLEDIIQLEILDATATGFITDVIGDGETVITLKATIPEDAATNFRTVTFEKSAGTFLTLNESASITADNNGIATIRMQVPLSDNLLYVAAKIGPDNELYRNEKQIDLIGVDQVLDLTVLNSQQQSISTPVRADGVSLLTLQAVVNYNQSTFNQIKFENSQGAFLGINIQEGTVSTDMNNMASINYRVPNTVGRVFFRASPTASNQVVEETFIDLARAYADNILIEPQLITMPINQTNTITVYLRRSMGNVSLGTQAEFEAFQLNSSGQEIPVGRFTGTQEALSDADGKVVATFVADTGNFDISQPVFIRVFTLTDSGATITETIPITIS